MTRFVTIWTYKLNSINQNRHPRQLTPDKFITAQRCTAYV